jgi:hypothetical protein
MLFALVRASHREIRVVAVSRPRIRRRTMKRIVTVSVAIAALAVFAATAVAQPPVEYKVTVTGGIAKGSPSEHFLTFDTPVAIPDATLPAGTYVFQMLGSSVVQVSSADRSQQWGMFFTAPVRRADAGDQYEVTLLQTGDKSPRRITQWFLPNQSLGFEFLYANDEVRGAR